MRYTEYHNGVAVIKDKNLLKEAMEKLAMYEDEEVDPSKEEMSYALTSYCFSKTYCDGCLFEDKDNCDFECMDYDELKTAYERMLEAQNKR